MRFSQFTMSWLFRISCFIIGIACVFNLGDDNVGQSRSINDPQPFRVNKLNMLWEKAKKVNVAFLLPVPVVRHMEHINAVTLCMRTV